MHESVYESLSICKSDLLQAGGSLSIGRPQIAVPLRRRTGVSPIEAIMGT